MADRRQLNQYEDEYNDEYDQFNGFNGFNQGFNPVGQFNGYAEDLPPYPYTPPNPIPGYATPFNPALNPTLNPSLNMNFNSSFADPNLLASSFDRLNLSNSPDAVAAALRRENQILRDYVQFFELRQQQQSPYYYPNLSSYSHAGLPDGGRCFCSGCREEEISAPAPAPSPRRARGSPGLNGINGFDNHTSIPRLQLGGGIGHFQRLLNPAMNLPLEEFRGIMAPMAKDQLGCKYLQRKVEGGDRHDINTIFAEIRGHICELMMDQTGNYLVQKLLDTCDGDQRNTIVRSVTKRPEVFVRVSCNTYGTRTLQKLLERLFDVEQQAQVIAAMKPGIVVLVTDIHGHHVVQYCLKKFPNELKKYIFDEVAAHTVEIGRHQNGCCVLQTCMQHSFGEIRELLLTQIAKNSLVLSQDPYGNYVVQYLLDMKIPQHTLRVLNNLEGNYALLAMQKNSSHVVEKCLILAREIGSTQLIKAIRELITSPDTLKILQDAYGNYVIQSALRVSFKVETRAFFEIVSAVKKHDTSLRSHPYGKRILQLIDQLIK